ncbi:MAG TPA: hypothetical protein VG295_12535 [Solirubrobacteraceae bacterium]|nr:hypothetical protein [Solirubrobacteraceae bacterium]
MTTATEGKRSAHEHGRALTLFVASLSAAGAAIVVHDLWKPGTILSAAISPVLVTTFDEMLHRPIDRLEALIRRRLGGARDVRTPRQDGPDRWRRAVITGVVAFLIGAVGLTIVELVLNHSLANGGDQTTLLGGKVRHRRAPSTFPLATTTRSTSTAPKLTPKLTAKPSRHRPARRQSTTVLTTTIILPLLPPASSATGTSTTTSTTTTGTVTTQTTTAPNGSTTVSTVTTPSPPPG